MAEHLFIYDFKNTQTRISTIFFLYGGKLWIQYSKILLL